MPILLNSSVLSDYEDRSREIEKRPEAVSSFTKILSSSGPGPRSGPGQVPGQVRKVQGLRTKDLDLGLVYSPPVNFSWGDNDSKPLVNDF